MRSVDVAVITWNDPPQMLDAAIGSALASVDVNVQIQVFDNGSAPPARVLDDSRVRLVRSEQNLGVAAGRNRAVALGTADIVCFLDSDAVLSEWSLARLIEPLRDGSVGLVVPVFASQRPEQSAGLAPTFAVKLARGLGRRGDYQRSADMGNGKYWDVDFGIGACQVFRRSVFDSVGGLDESIFYGPEDVDFCLRVRAAGHRIVQVDDTAVHHPPRRSHRRPFTWRGVKHGASIIRHLRRHRSAKSSGRVALRARTNSYEITHRDVGDVADGSD